MGRCRREVITWQNSGVDCEEIYNQRRRGIPWNALAQKTSVGCATLPRIINDWIEDTGKDPLPTRIKLGLVDCTDYVDRGRVLALYKAKWGIKDIAIDCGCTEKVVMEVINEIN